MITIIKPGLYTSLQDLGRYNHSHYGVPTSGSMDSLSSRGANILLGNPSTASVMECTITGPEILFHVETSIAITGAVIQPFINSKPSYLNRVISIKAGDILSFGKIVTGARFYIGVSGGFMSQVVLDSRSVCITSSILNILRKEDSIELSKDKPAQNQQFFKLRRLGNKIIEVKKGPEFEMIKNENHKVESIFKSTFIIRNESNRMAYRVNHDQDLRHNRSILSSGTMAGTVQLTPDGEIIFLMRDAQTTGGYPRILQLTEIGICDLSQMKSHEKFSLNLSSANTL